MFALILGLSALAGLVFGCCALFGLRERTWGSALLVALGPTADAGLTAWLLHWMGLGPVLTVLAAAIVGLASSLFIPALLWPRRALVAKLALRSIRARPKQAALLIVALIVSSSIVSSPATWMAWTASSATRTAPSAGCAAHITCNPPGWPNQPLPSAMA